MKKPKTPSGCVGLDLYSLTQRLLCDFPGIEP
jgi:hypothetical protein